jgi:catechol-2,3-dioxygenase
VAFNIGGPSDALRLARKALDASAIPVLDAAERAFTKSMHLLDPDGNEIELHIDVHPQSSDTEHSSGVPR